MPECPHGLDTRWCSTCLHGPRRKPGPLTVVRRFSAQYEGRCVECHEAVYPEDAIALVMADERQVGYVHSRDCEPVP